MLAGNPSAKFVVRALVRGAAWLALALSSYWALRLAWADQLSRGAPLAGRERAFQLAPAAIFAVRLAGRREELGGDSLPDWRRASALDPENPEWLMRLALRAELAGDYALAEKSLLAAAARSRLYQPKYLLAQYYFRRQDAGLFWPWARAALETAYGDAAPVFELCWRMRPNAAWLSANIIPPRRAIARQYLAYLINREQWAAAAAAARRMLPAAQDADRAGLLAYCEARLSRADAREAAEIWNALCRRSLLPDEALDPGSGRLVTNGDFRHAPSGRGFDWHLVAQSGVSAAAAGGRLRVAFTGRQAERCALAWQYVLTVPGTRYRLGCEARAAGDEPAAGIVWEVPEAARQAEPARPAGLLEFVAAQGLTRIVLTYQRPPGETRLEGTVAVANVRLERAP